MKKRDSTEAAKSGPVPYSMLSPGFEAAYTGEKREPGSEQVETITTLSADEWGNEIRRWPVIPWTWPGGEGDWDQEILRLNRMQAGLGPLDGDTRRIRAHIASLVPCDSGFPVTVDELLNAIGRGKLDEPSFHNGCWCPGMWWQEKSTQPHQARCMEEIRVILIAYLAGRSREEVACEFPHAKEFIGNAWKWLGPREKFRVYQKLMLQRMMLVMEFFAGDSPSGAVFTDPETLRRQETFLQDFFGKGGRGVRLDSEISEKTGLPGICPIWEKEYADNLANLEDPGQRDLYRTCCSIASGVYTLSDCHHNTFRFIESWIHGIGTGRLEIETRRPGAERERLAHLLFGYVLGLDGWLAGIPLPFLLLRLGHLDFGFDPRNEVLRVYAYLGEARDPVREWLAACLWHNLFHCPIGGNPGGLVRHRELLEGAAAAGVSMRWWLEP